MNQSAAAVISLGGGENTATHEIIEAATVTVPLSANAGIGIVGAHLGSEWLEGGATLSLGATNNLPVIGGVTYFAGDGVVYDFLTRAPANYAFAGVEKDWPVNVSCKIGLGAVSANTSDRAGVDLLGGAHISFNW